MVRVSISRDKKKFPHQLNDSLETDIWFLCHILLVKDVTRSNRIQGVKDIDSTSYWEMWCVHKVL